MSLMPVTLMRDADTLEEFHASTPQSSHSQQGFDLVQACVAELINTVARLTTWTVCIAP